MSNDEFIQKIRCIADYQFGKDAGESLFPDEVTVVLSKRTGRIRYVYLKRELLAILKPSNGLFCLTIRGAERIMATQCSKTMLVEIQEEVSPFIIKGLNVFAKHVISANEEIRPGEEVIVVNPKNRILAVGKAVLSGKEMKSFNRGVAVQVRRGNNRES